VLPNRRWVLILGYTGAILAAAHAYAFRVIIDAISNPEDMRERLTFFAANRSLFLVWIFAAVGLWIVLVALLPAIWRALGRGWAATAVVLLLFAGAVVNLAGDGAQFPTRFLSANYAAAAESLRPGLEAAAQEVSRAVSTLIMPGGYLFFLGSLAIAVVAAIGRPPAGRWYGLLFFLFALSNVPVGPPLVAAVLNLLFFGGFAYLTERGLAREGPA
jgi:hypothetical protein